MKITTFHSIGAKNFATSKSLAKPMFSGQLPTDSSELQVSFLKPEHRKQVVDLLVQSPTPLTEALRIPKPSLRAFYNKQIEHMADPALSIVLRDGDRVVGVSTACDFSELADRQPRASMKSKSTQLVLYEQIVHDIYDNNAVRELPKTCGIIVDGGEIAILPEYLKQKKGTLLIDSALANIQKKGYKYLLGLSVSPATQHMARKRGGVLLNEIPFSDIPGLQTTPGTCQLYLNPL